MTNKLAKLKYLPNTFEVIEKGDHVICAVSNKKILLENLNYWNFYRQREKFILIIFAIYYESRSTDQGFLISSFPKSYLIQLIYHRYLNFY